MLCKHLIKLFQLAHSAPSPSSHLPSSWANLGEISYPRLKPYASFLVYLLYMTFRIETHADMDLGSIYRSAPPVSDTFLQPTFASPEKQAFLAKSSFPSTILTTERQDDVHSSHRRVWGSYQNRSSNRCNR